MPLIRACKHCGQQNRVPGRHIADAGRCGNCKNPLPPADQPIDVDPTLFDEITQHARVPVLVDFWAEWCGPCHMAAPEVVRTAKNMGGRAIVVKVDTERYPQLAARFKVQGIPNFVVLHQGQLIQQQAGVVGHEEMERWLQSAALSAA